MPEQGTGGGTRSSTGAEKGLARASGGAVERAGRPEEVSPPARRSLMPAPGQGFGVTFGQIFKKVTTEEYPEVPKVTKPRYHGRHVLNRHPDGLEKCVGCELCAWACPADAIYVEGADNTEDERYSPGERYGRIYQINYLRCIFCGLCIEACPTRSLTMGNDFELADDNRRDLIFTKEQLMAPLLPGMEAPPHPMRLGDDEKDYYVRVPDPAATGDDRPAAPPADPSAGSREDQPVAGGQA